MPRLPLPPAEPMELDSLAEVARGGMGSVELVRVLDGRLAGQLLAAKRLHANIAEDPEFVSMFLDEAWITAALRHPNVAQVIAWGTDGKGPFLAIELVQGVSLSRLLKEAQTNEEPFAERTVAFICSQICAGLTAAHSLTAPDGSPMAVVHRDLTPANVLVSFDGEVKIIDFGIAKAEERISHTRTGQLKGKPAYMAPEQQRGGQIDHRADIFAFGVLMFEILAGRRPWTAKGPFDVMMEIAHDPHPDLGELRKGLNPELIAVAHRCLEKKPDARFQSAAEIKARLDAWLAARGFTAGDRQSLAQFVQRNSQPQVKWWQEALRGEHAKKKAPTFKELEERIDEEREKREKAEAQRAAPPPPPRPAAGAAPTLTGTRPMFPLPAPAAAGPSSTPLPGVVRPPPMGTQPMQQYVSPTAADMGGPPSSGPMSPPVPPSSGQRSSLVGAGPLSSPAPLSSHGPLSPPVPQPPYGATSSPVPQLPYGAMSSPMPQPPYGAARPPDPSASYPPSQRWSTPQPPPAYAPPAGTESGTLPMSPSALPYSPRQTGTGLPAPVMPVAQGPMSVAAPVLPAPVVPKRSRVGLVLLLVAVPVIGAAAGAWFFRDQLFDSGSPATAGTGKPAVSAGKAR